MPVVRFIAFSCALGLLPACGAAQSRRGEVAAQCEISHDLTGDDEVSGRIDRLTDGWLVALRVRVTLPATGQSLEVRGTGHVSGDGAARRCRVLEAPESNSAPRFDEALCLDEFESIAELLLSAEQSVEPGTTLVREVRLQPTRRRRIRAALGLQPTGFQERAEVTRDASGRVVRLVRATNGGGREVINVTYPGSATGRCVLGN